MKTILIKLLAAALMLHTATACAPQGGERENREAARAHAENSSSPATSPTQEARRQNGREMNAGSISPDANLFRGTLGNCSIQMELRRSGGEQISGTYTYAVALMSPIYSSIMRVYPSLAASHIL